MKAVAVIAVLAGGLLAGCSTLPTAGPTARDVEHQEIKDNEQRFDLVDINDKVVAALLARPLESFQARFKKYGRPPQDRKSTRLNSSHVEISYAVFCLKKKKKKKR